MMRTAKSQAGVMLIESLVGILIFSVGILALIGMQGAAMRNTSDARYRSEAAFLASEIIGQMWVDMAAFNTTPHYGTASGTFAARDAWETRVAQRLPGVNLSGATRPTIVHARIGTPPAHSDEVTVTIQWQQPGESAVRRVSMVNRIAGVGDAP